MSLIANFPENGNGAECNASKNANVTVTDCNTPEIGNVTDHEFP
jgi:hypothetical protein